LPRLLRFIVVNFGIEYFLRRVRAYINKLIYNRPNAHLVYIEEGYSVYGSYGVAKEKIFVTDNSTDTDLLAQTEISIEGLPRILPPSSNRVLHVGRLTKWKRVDLLIQSTARLKNDFPNIELVIIGEGPELESLQSLANSLGVKEYVRFIGGVYDADELARYFKASSIYVLAGKGGLSINDAMFYGLPIICSVCDGTEKKLVRDGFNGSIFEEGSEEDLVEKISIILGDEELQKNMSKNSKMIINKEINIHTVLEKWKEGFDYVLSKK
jgi:glycosyltransferase involved in cell wall biosynthesis